MKQKQILPLNNTTCEEVYELFQSIITQLTTEYKTQPSNQGTIACQCSPLHNLHASAICSLSTQVLLNFSSSNEMDPESEMLSLCPSTCLQCSVGCLCLVLCHLCQLCIPMLCIHSVFRPTQSSLVWYSLTHSLVLDQRVSQGKFTGFYSPKFTGFFFIIRQIFQYC